MNNIDILEEKEKKAIRMCDVLFISLDEIYKDGAQEYRMYYKTIKNLIENLISANKELKKEKDRVGKLYYEANENCIKYEKDYIPKSKVRELAKKYEFALNGYIELLENDNHIPHID